MGIGSIFRKMWSGVSSEDEVKSIGDEEDVSPYAGLSSNLASSHPKPVRVKDTFVLDLDESHPSGLVDTVALYLPEKNAVAIRDRTSGKAAQILKWVEPEYGIPIFGDWVGENCDLLAVYDADHAIFHVFSTADLNQPAINFHFGPPGLGWIPLAGDWDGDGRDGIGLYDPVSGTFLLRNELSGGPPDIQFAYGPADQGWVPLTGDWNGDGRDEVGVYHPYSGTFLLSCNLQPLEEHGFNFRVPKIATSWRPVVGDWSGCGKDGVGLYDPRKQIFHLFKPGTEGKADQVFRFGAADESVIPLALKFKYPITDDKS